MEISINTHEEITGNDGLNIEEREVELNLSEMSEETEHAHNLRTEISVEEVSYEEGATELFRAIENCEWDTAVELCRDEANDVRIWVTNSGDKNSTLFNWNVWRRLPIHEACRRRAPFQLITILLSVYPESAVFTTQLSELPIHLAAGNGATVDVINCILASNPFGIAAVDNSGRTPLEIFQESGSSQEDSQLVLESLERCMFMYTQHNNEVETENNTNKEEYEESLQLIQEEHEAALAVKDQLISDLQKEVERGESKTKDLTFQIDERDHKIDSKRTIEKNLMDMVSELEDEISTLRSKNRELHSRIVELDDKAMNQESTMEKLSSKITLLEEELGNISVDQDLLVENELRDAELDLRKMVESQRRLITRIRKQKETKRSVANGRRAKGDVSSRHRTSSSGSNPTSPKKVTSPRKASSFKKGNNISSSKNHDKKIGLSRISAAAQASLNMTEAASE